MKPGDFKPVTTGGKAVGFIHLRTDGAFEATRHREGETEDEAFESEKGARGWASGKLTWRQASQM